MDSCLDIELSTKAIGAFEQVIIDKVCQHFRNLSYAVYPHVQLNVAWGPIISDIDVLAKQNDEITVIEVKSMHDDISRAKPQLDNIAGYIDYAYVATDRLPRKWNDSRIGLLFVSENGVRCLKRADRLNDRPNVDFFFALRKKCLHRLIGNEMAYQTKYALAECASRLGDSAVLRKQLKEIVTCGRKCDTDCPIWQFAKCRSST